MKVPTSAEIGNALNATALAIAPRIAYTYPAGWYTGQTVHWLSANYTNLPQIVETALYENAKHLLHPDFDDRARAPSLPPVESPPKPRPLQTHSPVDTHQEPTPFKRKTKAELRQLVRERFGPGTRLNDQHYARARKAELLVALTN